MTTTPHTPTNDPEQHEEGPNFLLIVLLFGASILIFITCAYVAVSCAGTKLLPITRPQAHQSSSLYSAPAKIIKG
jgi:hypothetical protein